MLDQLQVYNFHPQAQLKQSSAQSFVLKTCQRQLVLEYGKTNQDLFSDEEFTLYEGENAYQFLLEIICGLQSKLIGENEIVGQFKKSYLEYVAHPEKDSQLLIIIEKLFKDAKEIRSKFLLGLCQKTYSSIARKHLINIHKGEEVLILGSGCLAEDLINQLKKKAKVFITARNFKKVHQLANEHDLQIIPWNNHNLYLNFSHIANTIGCEEIILDQKFFQKWSQRHENKFFVDLGSPCAIQTALNYDEGVMTLNDIFLEGAVHEDHKKNQIKKAKFAIEQAVEKRYIHLKEKMQIRKKIGEDCEFKKAI